MFSTGILNLTNWVANVIMPTLAGLFLAGAIYHFSKAQHYSHFSYAGFAALMCSGLLRLLETFAQQAWASDPDRYWISILTLVNWVGNVILRVYKRAAIRPSNPIPTFGDLRDELAQWRDEDKNQRVMDEAHLAAIKLRSWTGDKGIYSKLFDRPTTISLGNSWLFFNVEQLADDPRLETAMSLATAKLSQEQAAKIFSSFELASPAEIKDMDTLYRVVVAFEEAINSSS